MRLFSRLCEKTIHFFSFKLTEWICTKMPHPLRKFQNFSKILKICLLPNLYTFGISNFADLHLAASFKRHSLCWHNKLMVKLRSAMLDPQYAFMLYQRRLFHSKPGAKWSLVEFKIPNVEGFGNKHIFKILLKFWNFLSECGILFQIHSVSLKEKKWIVFSLTLENERIEALAAQTITAIMPIFGLNTARILFRKERD